MTAKRNHENESGNPWHEWKALDALMRDVIRRLREGATPEQLKEAIEAIHRAAFRLLLAILMRRRVRNALSEAENLAADFCEILLRAGLPTYDLSRPFWPYGLRMLTSLCNNRGRDKFAQAASLIEGMRDTKALEPVDELKQDIRRKMRRHVARLPRYLRRAIILRFWLGATPRDAAKFLGISEGLFHQWTFKARRILRDSYGPDGELDAA